MKNLHGLKVILAGLTALALLSAGQCEAAEPAANGGQTGGPAARPAQPAPIWVKVEVTWTAKGRRQHLPIDIFWEEPSDPRGNHAVSTHADGRFPVVAHLKAGQHLTVEVHQAEDGYASCAAFVTDGGNRILSNGQREEMRYATWISCTITNNAPVD